MKTGRKPLCTQLFCKLTISDKIQHVATAITLYAPDPRRTRNEGLRTQYRFNFGPALQPIVGSMPVNRIRRWPNIETELGDCPLFALTAIRVH